MDSIANDGTGEVTFNVSSADFETSRLMTPTQVRRKIRNIVSVVAGVMTGLYCTLLFSIIPDAETNGYKVSRDAFAMSWIAITLFSSLGLAAAIPWFITRRTYMKNQNEHFAERIAAERERHKQALEQLKKTTELATLMGLNQGQIKTYHDIVTEQADKSFKSSRAAMNVGLLLLVAAAVGGVYVPMEEIRWFIGALALFSTLLSGYLSRTYLLLYRESISQLNRYFDQPVLNSFYLTAERLTAGLDVEHAQNVRQQIINQVLETSTNIGGRPVEPTTERVMQAQARSAKKPKKPKPKKQAAPVNGTPRA